MTTREEEEEDPDDEEEGTVGEEKRSRLCQSHAGPLCQKAKTYVTCTVMVPVCSSVDARPIRTMKGTVSAHMGARCWGEG